MRTFPISKIVSGGQTGVDRAALDVAIYLEIEHGGWCPHGRRSESGRIPDTYNLRETNARDYSVRTEQNVIDSDGTLILYQGKLSGGTELTYKLAMKHNRPIFCFNLDECNGSDSAGVTEVLSWIEERNVNTLNVAGPRQSSAPGIAKLAESFLVKTLSSPEN